MSRLTGLSTQQSLGDCLTLAFSKNTNGTDIRLRDELIYNLTIGFNQRAGLITMSKTRFYYLEMLLNNFPEVKKAVNDFFQQHYQVANFVEQLMTLYQGKNGIHCYSLQQLRGTPSGGAPVYARPTVLPTQQLFRPPSTGSFKVQECDEDFRPINNKK